MELDTQDRQLMNMLQAEFPLVEEPFAAMGAHLGVSAGDVITRIARLKAGGMVRWISGVFDPWKIGYRTTLAAMRVPPERLDAAAGVVSAHPGVSHNYARRHDYNLWFTLSVPKERSLEAALQGLAQLAQPLETLNLPAVRVFKRRVFVDMMADTVSHRSTTGAEEPEEEMPHSKAEALSEQDRNLVRLLQADLPLRERPFAELGKDAGISAVEVLGYVQRLHDRGIMRRYGASIGHRKAGLVANALSCWDITEAKVRETGRRVAHLNAVSHCYERRRDPRWPYNLFAMIHGRSEDDCEAVAEEIARDTATSHYVLLYSSVEYKKEKVPYFENLN
jgi:DNA-binding Lrp family transcriptional regulator